MSNNSNLRIHFKIIPFDPEQVSKAERSGISYTVCHWSASLGPSGSLSADGTTVMEDIHLQRVY